MNTEVNEEHVALAKRRKEILDKQKTFDPGARGRTTGWAEADRILNVLTKRFWIKTENRFDQKGAMEYVRFLEGVVVGRAAIEDAENKKDPADVLKRAARLKVFCDLMEERIREYADMMGITLDDARKAVDQYNKQAA